MMRQDNSNVSQNEPTVPAPMTVQETAALNDTTIPYREDGREEARLNLLESQLRENALVSQIEKRIKRAATPSTPVANNDGDLRDSLRGTQRPTDLRNAVLNRNQDVRKQLKPRTENPSDLRNSHLNPIRDRKERSSGEKKFGTKENFYGHSPITATENNARQLAKVRQMAKESAELEIERKRREEAIVRLRAIVRGDDQQQRDESSDEGEAENSDTSTEGVEPGSALEEEMTGVVYSESETADGNQKPGPSKVSSNREPISETTISPIRFPTAQSTPIRTRSGAAQLDLRERLNNVPVSSNPKLVRNKRPIFARLGKQIMYPEDVWQPGRSPTDQENAEYHGDAEGDDEETGRVTEEDDVTTDEMEDEDYTNKKSSKKRD